MSAVYPAPPHGDDGGYGGGPPPNLDDHLEELDDDVRSLLERLRNAPTDDDLVLLRSEDRIWTQLARVDVRPWLVSWFTPSTDWGVDRGRSGPIEVTSSVGVAWSFGGKHDIDMAFNRLRASGRPVEVQGFTVLGVEESRFRLWRYVDWVGLYSQLGLTMSWRLPLPAEVTPEPIPTPSTDQN